MTPSATDRRGTVTRITQAPRLRAPATPPSAEEPHEPAGLDQETLDRAPVNGDADRSDTQVHKRVAARLTVPAAELLRSRETEDPYIDALLQTPQASPGQEQPDDRDTVRAPADELDERDEAFAPAFTHEPPVIEPPPPTAHSLTEEQTTPGSEEPLVDEHPLADEGSLADEAPVDPADTSEQDRDDFFDGLTRSAPSIPTTQPIAAGSAGLDADSALRRAKPRPAPQPTPAPAREDNVLYLPHRRRPAAPGKRAVAKGAACGLVAAIAIAVAIAAAMGSFTSTSHHPTIAAKPATAPVHTPTPASLPTAKHAKPRLRAHVTHRSSTARSAGGTPAAAAPATPASVPGAARPCS